MYGLEFYEIDSAAETLGHPGVTEFVCEDDREESREHRRIELRPRSSAREKRHQDEQGRLVDVERYAAQ